MVQLEEIDFDTKGNNGFFPIMLQLNIGFNAKKW